MPTASMISRKQHLLHYAGGVPGGPNNPLGVRTLYLYSGSRDTLFRIHRTIHSAKGQEWKSVFVLNTVDGCIPSDLGVGTTADIEEERRLCSTLP